MLLNYIDFNKELILIFSFLWMMKEYFLINDIYFHMINVSSNESIVYYWNVLVLSMIDYEVIMNLSRIFNERNNDFKNFIHKNQA
jgi:hypothetical protein